MVERRGRRVTTVVTQIIIATTVSQAIQIYLLICEEFDLLFPIYFSVGEYT